MNPRIVYLSAALLALAGLLGWRLRVRYLDAQAHERAVLNHAAHPRPVPPPPPAPVPAPIAPADYVDVAQKTLFSQDRNPNVVIEPAPAPPPPPPPPPMPALPVYYGQMSLGDPVVVLTTSKTPEQKSYRVGDTVGDFKLVAFDRDSITLEWNGKTIERNLHDLAPKEPQPQVAASPAAAPAAAPSAAPTPAASNKPPAVGVDMGGGFRACSGDSAPAGTIVDGYRKVITQSLMGQTCHWEPVK